MEKRVNKLEIALEEQQAEIKAKKAINTRLKDFKVYHYRIERTCYVDINIPAKSEMEALKQVNDPANAYNYWEDADVNQDTWFDDKSKLINTTDATEKDLKDYEDYQEAIKSDGK
jgi:hypothetical protein